MQIRKNATNIANNAVLDLEKIINEILNPIRKIKNNLFLPFVFKNKYKDAYKPNTASIPKELGLPVNDWYCSPPNGQKRTEKKNNKMKAPSMPIDIDKSISSAFFASLIT